MVRLSTLSRSVSGTVTLVTGAGSGIGRATARLFADEGAVVAVTDVDAAAAEAVASEIVAAGATARAWGLDVGDPTAIASVLDQVAAELGDIGVLVNNAGVSLGRPIDAADYEDMWEPSISIMLTAHMRTARAALPQLRRVGDGRIINIASTEALGATPRNSAYAAAKHGVIGLTRGLAVELGREGITVNAICPGPIRTGMTEAIPEEAKETFARRRVPLRRYADPEELAHAVLHLALPASSFINGATLVVDGGLTIKNA